MKQENRTWQPVINAFFIFIVLLILFYFYTTQNRARIQEQNRIYAEDCARQTVGRIESEFDNALQRLENSAFLVAAGTKTPKIDTQILKEMEDNTSFNAISFTNADGIKLGPGVFCPRHEG